MPQQLLDGTGDGFLAKVNTDNRLLTDAVTLSRSANASFTGDSYNAKTVTGLFYKGAEGNTFTNGTKVIESIFNQSATRAAIGVGAIILPPGSSIGIED